MILYRDIIHKIVSYRMVLQISYCYFPKANQSQACYLEFFKLFSIPCLSYYSIKKYFF